MELARRLAETIARVQDPLMRGEVANKASARLGVPRSDFERLLTKPSRERFSTDDEPRPAVTAPPRHEIGMLCLLALRHEEARAFLLAQDWRALLSHTPDAEILGRILARDLRPGRSGLLNASCRLPQARSSVSSCSCKRCRPTAWRSRKAGGTACVRLLCGVSFRSRRAEEAAAPDDGRSGQFAQKQILTLRSTPGAFEFFSSAHVLDT